MNTYKKLSHLQQLEAESIYILREVAAQFEKPALLFSGGKDSTALLKILYSAALKAKDLPKVIDVIYCDTGVENPLLDRYVKTLFARLEDEFINSSLPFRTQLLKAPVADRFFVKIIGFGTEFKAFCFFAIDTSSLVSFINV